MRVLWHAQAGFIFGAIGLAEAAVVVGMTTEVVHDSGVNRAGSSSAHAVWLQNPTTPRRQESMIGAMKALDLPPRRRRGNPEWGKLKPVHVVITEFETEVARLGLKKSGYVASAALKRWCTHNRNRVYVPEWLLAEWGMRVDPHSSAA